MARSLVIAPIIAVVLGLIALGASHSPAGATTSCGVERWAVKTLSDPRANLVDFTPRDTSVGRLRRKADPHTSSSTPRLDGVETTTYRLKARLVEFKREDDHDIHLVIAVPSSSSKTMIVEFPDTGCPGARDSAKKAQMARARTTLTNACGQAPSSDFADLRGTAIISGVGFFDVKHPTPQTGVAPNNIELHPVLRVSGISCARAPG
jgi:hypothetical protein